MFHLATFGYFNNQGHQTYLIPALADIPAHLAPSLPWRDEEAMRRALAMVGYAWEQPAPGELRVTLPCRRTMTFSCTGRTWRLSHRFLIHRQGLREVAMLARAYAYSYIAVAAERYGWTLEEVQHSSGHLEVTCREEKKDTGVIVGTWPQMGTIRA